ncbi:MAG: class I SAM-dependent methyltransferase [Lachnospiraceae bacterium]|nr:class I SAM-dependent methyltransferase [Lachnospiraceae bacterium]
MNNIKLSKRLECIVSNVKSGGIVADIGCDHAFTSICLVERKLAKGAIAMDINKEPLKRAKKHITEAGMEEYILTRLSDGAKELKEGEADTILISGLGGALITDILSKSLNIIKTSEELVLSPQSEIYLVRHFLHDNGFKIVHEDMVKEQGKFYVIIRAVQGEEHYKEEAGYIYGEYLAGTKNPVLKEFLIKEQKRIENILDNFVIQEKRKGTLLKEYNMIKSILYKTG